MAPERKALTAAQVATVRTPGKYHDGGGMGLMLRVQLNGARQWVQRIRFAGRRIEIGLGSPPAVSLAQARERAIDNKRLARGGSDPRRSKQAARAAVTFGEASERYLASKLAEFRNARHREQWRATLRAYALPALGRMAVRDIGVAEVLGALEPIWWEKTVTATRVRQRIEAVLSWARVAGLREGDNPARWQGNLSELLPKPGRIVRTMHHPAVALGDAARWWQDSSRRDGMAVQALRFAVLCAARSGEVRHATWAEFDLDSAIWTVPAERMKAGVEHRVPLTEAAVALLGNLPRLEASPFVFFAARGGALSDMALSQVMRRLQEADDAFVNFNDGLQQVCPGPAEGALTKDVRELTSDGPQDREQTVADDRTCWHGEDEGASEDNFAFHDAWSPLRKRGNVAGFGEAIAAC